MALPRYTLGQSSEEFRKAFAELPRPGEMLTWMMIGYGISGIVFVGGMVVTAMGLIDYAAEVRRRG